MAIICITLFAEASRASRRRSNKNCPSIPLLSQEVETLQSALEQEQSHVEQRLFSAAKFQDTEFLESRLMVHCDYCQRKLIFFSIAVLCIAGALQTEDSEWEQVIGDAVHYTSAMMAVKDIFEGIYDLARSKKCILGLAMFWMVLSAMKDAPFELLVLMFPSFISDVLLLVYFVLLSDGYHFFMESMAGWALSDIID